MSRMLVRNNIIFKKIRNICAFSSNVVDSQEQIIKIGKHNINYIKVGHGTHSCILTPGVLGTIWTNYKEQIQRFDRSQFTLVVWDPPGFGKSYPPEREFNLQSYENDADIGYELMKTLEIPKFSVLGWSAGSAASLILAAKYPEAIRKLVVWGTSPYVVPSEIAAFQSLRDVNKWSKRLRDPMIEIYGKERFAQYWRNWVDCMSAALEENNDICCEFLKDIKCPTLILYGAKDSLVDAVHAPYLKENIKNSLLHIYPEGKHEVHIQYAEDFNRRVQDFLMEP